MGDGGPGSRRAFQRGPAHPDVPHITSLSFSEIPRDHESCIEFPVKSGCGNGSCCQDLVVALDGNGGSISCGIVAKRCRHNATSSKLVSSCSGLQDLCEVAVSEWRELVQHHAEDRPIGAPSLLLALVALAHDQLFCNSIFPKARTGSVFLLTFNVTNRISPKWVAVGNECTRLSFERSGTALCTEPPGLVAQPLPIVVPCALVVAEPCAWAGAR